MQYVVCGIKRSTTRKETLRLKGIIVVIIESIRDPHDKLGMQEGLSAPNHSLDGCRSHVVIDLSCLSVKPPLVKGRLKQLN